LVASMPRRVADVIKARGGHFIGNLPLVAIPFVPNCTVGVI